MLAGFHHFITVGVAQGQPWAVLAFAPLSYSLL
jgi:hypothetical protein